MTKEELLDKAYQLTGEDPDRKHAAFWLLLEYFEITPTEYYIDKDKIVSKNQIKEYIEKLKLYTDESIPVQYIIGHSYFYGFKFYVTKATLIPRAETELLVYKTINLIKEKYKNKNTIKVLDMATGSGCIGLTIKKELSDKVDVTLLDVSEEALKVARENKEHHNLNVEIIRSDWFSNVTEKYDVIISNPPYIPDEYIVDEIVNQEPKIALYGGEKGIDPYIEIMKNHEKYLNENGIIAFEHGYDQKQYLYDILKDYEGKIIQEQDLSKRDRYSFLIKGDKNG